MESCVAVKIIAMLQMKMTNWRAEEKIYIDNVEGAISRENFFMVLFSGAVPFVFVFSPSHLKRIMQWFKYTVQEYERMHGPIQGENWKEPILSPYLTEEIK